MARTALSVTTRDGVCPASLFRPDGAGTWPGVLMYMDGAGIRPAMFAIADRIAQAGYVVLLPDLFYRTGPYEAPDLKTLFSDPVVRQTWAKHTAAASAANVMSDTAALLDALAAQADVRPGKVGVTGYCVGGRLALTAAGTYPERIAAAASFHGGNLATDAADSPHHLAPRMAGVKVLVVGAEADATFPDDQKRRLGEALTGAGVDHRLETWSGLRHGWVPSDAPVHSRDGAERHFQALLDLFAAALR